MRVLVIEDDEELAETVAAGLRHARMAVDVALDGASGLARALVHDYDVIVLDRDLPGRARRSGVRPARRRRRGAAAC